jgi:hypothetical protein
MKSNRVKGTIENKPRIGSNILFVLLGMALMAPALLLKPVPQARDRAAVKVSVPPLESPAMPWGDLECTHFALAQPERYLPDSSSPWPSPAWYFERTAPQQLAALFNSAETSPSTRRLLLDTNRWEISGDIIVVRPTTELLLGLGRPARERIYAVLANSPINMPQHFPFRFRKNGFDQWFAQSRLAPEKLELIRSLTYTNRGGAMCLADLDVLQEKLGREEYHRLFESLYSEHSVFLSLRVKPSADLERLARYWGSGGREQEVLAMLKSIAQLPGGGSINVAYLLPSFARMRLYTFAPVTNDFTAAGQDCFWTALNFFRTEAEAQTTTGDRSLERLMSQYAETLEAPQFGDVILFMENRKAAHACVYIADDVVFTKNGANFHQPWVLMKMNDVLPRYATDRPMSLVVLRRKTT